MGGYMATVAVNAIVFAMVPTAAILLVSRTRHITPTTMVIAGIAMMYVFTAATSLLMLLADPEHVQEAYEWNIGSLGRASWSNIGFVIAGVVPCMLFLQMLSRRINIMNAGNRCALSMGVDVRMMRNAALLVIAVMTAITVGVTGGIGFMGLVAPHLARILVGSDLRYLLPCSAGIGALILIAADAVSRVVIPEGIPVGVLTAVVGGPVFILVLIRSSRKVWFRRKPLASVCDTMEKKTLGLLAAVIAVAVIAAAAFALTGGDEEKSIEVPEIASGTGTVYGNADGNCFIDEVDVAVIESIIAGERSFADFPFADADCDGDVDADDLQMVGDIIAGKSMKVNVLDTQDNVVPVQYPVDSFIVLSGSNLAPLMNVLDVSDKVAAAAYNTLDPVRDYAIVNGIDEGRIVKLSPNGTAADLDAISKLEGTKVMLTEYSGMYDLDSDENIKILNDWGIDVLCMECRDPGDDTRSMAVFGILLDRGKEAQGYIDFVNGIYDHIKEVEGDRFGETTVLISSLTGSLCGRTSGYTTMIEEMAGGRNLADWDASSKKVTVGDTWIFAEKYVSDMLLLGTSSNYGGTGFTEKDIAAYTDRYSNTDAWKNRDAYIYSTSIPVVCRVAYFAEAMYPDLFEDGWANSVHQLFVDTYFDTEFEVVEEQFFKRIN